MRNPSKGSILYVNHMQHLWIMSCKLRNENLYVEFSKYELQLESVSFLGHAMTKDCIIVDLAKFEVVCNWSRPTSSIEIWSLVCLSGYYKYFVEVFTFIADLLTHLTQNKIYIQWCDAYNMIFQKLKHLFTLSPIFTLPKEKVGFPIICDASELG